MTNWPPQHSHSLCPSHSSLLPYFAIIILGSWFIFVITQPLDNTKLRAIHKFDNLEPSQIHYTTTNSTLESSVPAPSASAAFSQPCALLFFGLAKKFEEIVLPTITSSILENNPVCDVYLHTFDVTSVSNPRNNEKELQNNPSEVLLLTPNAVIESMESFNSARNVSYYRQFFPSTGGWTYPISMDNMIKQWHSIESVWQQMVSNEKVRKKFMLRLYITLTLAFAKSGNFVYTRVGLFRADVVYETPISINDGISAVVTDWGHYGGLNDRLFYGERKNAAVWATGRFPQAESYALAHNNEIHSERFMKALLAHIEVTQKHICFKRVRANGYVMPDC